MKPWLTCQQPDARAQTTPASPWQLLASLVSIAGFVTCLLGIISSCEPTQSTPMLEPLSEDTAHAASLDNPRLADMMTADSAQRHTKPLTFRPRIHHASYTGFNQRLRLAADNLSWHIPGHQPGDNRFSTRLILPQNDLHVLAELQAQPEAVAERLARQEPRPPTPGPLIAIEVSPDRYWTISQGTKLAQIAGASAFFLGIIACCIAAPGQNKTKGDSLAEQQ